ncbi:MAG: response regulator transcription factor [Nitrososphaerota archaeon]|nr:response regulator transcription factor [Nitrososphaerota archaeon]
MPLNILIAEDEEDIAEQYKMGFEDRGHKVTITYNGVECINVYRRARQTLDDEDPIIFDAVIIDHNMPLKDGATLAEEIREINPEQTIVFATAYGNQLITGLDSFEDVDILAKPLSIKNLVRLVEERFYNKVLA